MIDWSILARLASYGEAGISAGQTNRGWAKVAVGETDFGHGGEFPRSSRGRLKEKVEPFGDIENICLCEPGADPAEARAVRERTS